MTDWISIAHELPKKHEYVLTWVPYKPWHSSSKTAFARVARLIHEDTFQEFTLEVFDIKDVTHWAKITEPK